MRKTILSIALCIPTFLSFAQDLNDKTQINFEDVPEAVKNTLFDEIEKMNLNNILFNFYKKNMAEEYPIEFLRDGVDIRTLGGLEYITFFKDGKILEKRYKFYSEELLIATPLEMIMTMQEKTAGHDLKYLTKIEITDGDTNYRAITTDSTYVFDEKMEFLQAVVTSDQ